MYIWYDLNIWTHTICKQRQQQRQRREYPSTHKSKKSETTIISFWMSGAMLTCFVRTRIDAAQQRKQNKKQNRRSERAEEEERTSTRTNRTFPNNVWPPRAATTEFALNPDTNTSTSTTPDQARPIPPVALATRAGVAGGGQWLWCAGGEGGQPWAFVVSGRRRVLEKLLLLVRLSSQSANFDLIAKKLSLSLTTWRHVCTLSLSSKKACQNFQLKKLE